MKSNGGNTLSVIDGRGRRTEGFSDRLRESVRRADSMLCIGLDPDPALLPVSDVLDFNRQIIDATSEYACAFKPNVGFYEALGGEGFEILRATIELIHREGLLAIADAKRADIGNTSRAYATATFDLLDADAITVSPYLGRDAIEPFLQRQERGVFVLCRTSNQGSRDLQDLEVRAEGQSRRLYEVVADLSKEWNANGNVALVVGATFPEELARVREICPDMPILVPGIGAQGGELGRVLDAGLDRDGGGLVINVSRQILYASSSDFARTARKVAHDLVMEMRMEVEKIRESRTRK